MKWFTVIFMVVASSTLDAAETSVAKGAVVEGLFILQNKTLDVKKAIQDFKKELTECFGKSEKAPQEQAVRPQPYKLYHSKLQQLLYPTYIDELGVLSASLEKDSALLNGGQPISKAVFDGIMNKAFLATEKIDHEKKLLAKIFEVDRHEHDLVALHQVRALSEEQRKAIAELPAAIRIAKEEVVRLKTRIVAINAELFTGDLKQEVFLDKLSFRRR